MNTNIIINKEQKELERRATPQKMKMKFEEEGDALDDDIDSSPPPAPEGKAKKMQKKTRKRNSNSKTIVPINFSWKRCRTKVFEVINHRQRLCNVSRKP